MLTTTSIDTTLKRYEIESFKKKNTKRVPFEEIDFNIYKTSQINYSTTEKRLPIWIKALYSRYIENKNFNETEINTSWQEIENPEDPAKCDKIILTFTNKENKNVLSITINVTAGRMKAQGRLYKEWSEIEFQIVLDMVNASCDTWKYDNTTAFKDIIQKKYKGDYSIIFFTDSTIVLTWIRSQSRGFKPFVSSRVAEIQTNCDPSTWRHIPSDHNVADELSRGIPAKELEERWQKGPEFLSKPEDEWPQQQALSVDLQEVERERRKTEAVLSIVAVPTVIDSKKFSKWKRLVRVTAWILRYVRNLRSKRKPKEEIDPLTADELERSEEFWIKKAQKELHGRVDKKEFNMLSPFKDEKEIIRVGG
jgi:hypothetical protein